MTLLEQILTTPTIDSSTKLPLLKLPAELPMSGNHSETTHGKGSTNDYTTPDMLVSGAEVQKFMQTLKTYSDSCSQCKKEVLSANKRVDEAVTNCEAINTQCVVAKAAVASIISDGKIQLGEHGASIKGQVMTQAARWKEEMERDAEKRKKELDEEGTKLRKERKQMEVLVEKAQAICRDNKRIAKKVEENEGYVCSFVEVVKHAEATSRQHYSRSLYAASVSREMNKSVLQTLRTTLQLVQSMYNLLTKISEDEMTDERPSETMTSSMETRLYDAMATVQTLQADCDDMARVVQVLDQVSLLDDSIRVLNGDMKGFCVGDEERAAKRQEIEKAVRRAMPFDKRQHKCSAAYEREVLSEVSKGMSSTDIVGSSLITAVLSTL